MVVVKTQLQTPVLIIGTGISGLFTALKIAESGISVVLITKNSLSENNSRYAQGGIAAVLPHNTDDSIELHLQDTLIAGAGLCNEVAVKSILSEGYDAVADLLLMGVDFDTDTQGALSLTLEGGHSVRRIIHAGGDATGRQVEMALIDKINASPFIQHLSHCTVTQLFVENSTVLGCQAVDTIHQTVLTITADKTVLATGGAGRLYRQSTNPAGSTGNGFALAYLAGAEMRDLEFVQFHPTAFVQNGEAHFLVSEALRGEGGILRNAFGDAFATQYHPAGELAPRDIVTRAIFAEERKQREQGADCCHVYLDMTHLPASTIENRFPSILTLAQSFGVDIRTDWIPVSPAAHYMMGGVRVDDQGQSTVNNLYIVGETLWTGLHGANRLASNSLLECLVVARRVARAIASCSGVSDNTPQELPLVEETNDDFIFEIPETLTADMLRLHQCLWENVGIVRTEPQLRAALNTIASLKTLASQQQYHRYVPLGSDYVHQLTLAELIAQAALARTESRGGHYREDYPQTEPLACHSIQHSQLPVSWAPCLLLQQPLASI